MRVQVSYVKLCLVLACTGRGIGAAPYLQL
ncbi:hypothetical protein LMG18101_01892 [Ralstonia flaminis]|jgi:hypothetical protein|uniref:Uncharacterized protein n=1 Tax=Ralstonia flaminis TaxID=3058597 RepID=A0ABN9JIV9_9RALS|nr:hypothetical protein LMG18101_01892 [Ralstonia sp. LMG 18101]